MSKPYVIDRVLHWVSSFLILFMLLNMSAQIHTVNYQLQGQLEHRQSAIETHAFTGLLLLTLLIIRIGWYVRFKAQIPRQEISKKKHRTAIKTIHALLYLTVLTLAASGLAMATNSDIPLEILGFILSDGGTQHVQQYALVREVHLSSITLFWWLIGLHFAGAIYARR